MKMGTQYFKRTWLLGLLGTVALLGCHPQEISKQDTGCTKEHKDREKKYKDALNAWTKLEEKAKKENLPLSTLPPKPEEPPVWDVLCPNLACGVNDIRNTEFKQHLVPQVAACRDNVKVVSKNDKEEANGFSDKILRCLSPEVITTEDRRAACIYTALITLTDRAQSVRSPQVKVAQTTASLVEDACLRAHKERVSANKNLASWEEFCAVAQCSIDASTNGPLKNILVSHGNACQENIRTLHLDNKQGADLLAASMLECLKPEVITTPVRKDACTFALLTSVTEKAQNIRAEKARAK